jgi:hypothetical protein
MSSGRRTIPEIYQKWADMLIKVRIVRPVNCDSLRRAFAKSPAQRAERGQIPIAPITRVRKNNACKPHGKDCRESLNFSYVIEASPAKQLRLPSQGVRGQARHTEASAISTPESNSNAQNVSETSALPQKSPPLLLVLHNALEPALLRFGQWQPDCR